MKTYAAMLLAGLFTVSLGQSRATRSADATLEGRVALYVRNQYRADPLAPVSVKATRAKMSGYRAYSVSYTSLNKQRATVTVFVSLDNQTIGAFIEMPLRDERKVEWLASKRPFLGTEVAPVTIVMYDDLECPYCSQMYAVLTETMGSYPGKVRVAIMDYPLDAIHPWALRASVDANCLGQEDLQAYWAFVSYMHTHSGEMNKSSTSLLETLAKIDQLAEDEGHKRNVDPIQMRECVTKQDGTGVKGSKHEAELMGVEATPTLFVNGEEAQGLIDKTTLRAMIDRALAAESSD